MSLEERSSIVSRYEKRNGAGRVERLVAHEQRDRNTVQGGHVREERGMRVPFQRFYILAESESPRVLSEQPRLFFL